MIYPFSPRPNRQAASPQWQLVKQMLPLVALLICGGLLWSRIGMLDVSLVRATVAAVTPAQWLMAALATWGSFHAIGRYDAVWHRINGTGVRPARARRAGMQAIALSQFLGFGAATGSLARWRALPELTLWQTTRITLAVTLTFTALWATTGLVAAWWLGLALSFAGLVLVLASCAWLADVARRLLAPDLHRRDAFGLLAWTVLDMILAALAIYVLLPAGMDLPFATLTAAFVLALGAGLISNAPGGAGAFELTLLALLPQAGDEPLLGAILAFRVVYYVGPAVLALILLARPAPTTQRVDHRSPAAWQLARQSGSVRQIDGAPVLVGSLPGVLATLGPAPQQARHPQPAQNILRHALSRGQIPALYNCDPRMALQARQAGWHVRRTVMEAVIAPATWTTEGRAKQGLRRKLRLAESAGVSVTPATGALPLAAMTALARNWADDHGGELGFSMGRYCPEYVTHQRVFLIRQGARLIGFITFHAGPDGWLLDLIRHGAGMPDGTMQRAITTAIMTAKSEGVAQLSLACVPDQRHTPEFWWRKRAGLIQFKRGFGPQWQPRYHAAPTRAGFWFTGLVIGIAIHRPLANLPFKLRRLAENIRAGDRFTIEVAPET